MNKEKDFVVVASEDPGTTPRRIAFIRKGVSAQVKREAETDDTVMTFPHLLVREVIAFEVMVIVLALISLFFDAPLEWIADPEHTPSPAKAPWYFLGLQELLHYFPPVVAGVLIPTLVVIALVVIPYFEINLLRRPLWEGRRQRTLAAVTAGVALIALATAPFHAYPILIPTLVFYGFMGVSYSIQRDAGWIGWLGRRSLAVWIMTWFVAVAVILTGIGVFFRGPGWRWSWPWIEGVY
jgi:hypothetical protein